MEQDIKESSTYRYVEKLMDAYYDAAAEGTYLEEIPINAVMAAPIPDWMPIAEAVRIKIMTVTVITKRMHHSLSQAMPYIERVITMIDKENSDEYF